MATPALIVVISVALLTLVVLALTIAVLVGHLKRLSATITQMKSDLEPSLSALAADAEVTRVELERVSDAMSGPRPDGPDRP
ncbi:MAG: hypothetical protein KY461_11685 [Actinobacteria bacterium]|nr:hypothetical protein [Actinomycetota bacterium]